MSALDGVKLIPLSELMETYGADNVKQCIEEYTCIKDSATEKFLQERALEMEMRDLSRTYVAIENEGMKILGYVTLSIKCMTIPKENLLSGKILKNMNIESKTGIAQSYLLGQLSRSSDAPPGLGKVLLDFAFDMLTSAKSMVGCRMIRLDCHNELIQYYSDYGFKLITKNDSNSLNQMMAFI